MLAVDFGTQSVRAIAFDRDGQTVAASSVAIDAPAQPEPGWAEHEADYLWERFCAACHALWQQGDCRDQLAAISLTTVRASVVALDASGKPLRPVILWSDRRRLEAIPAIGGLTGALLDLAGAGNTIAALQREAEANWLAVHEPRMWENCAKFVLLSGYLHYRISGAFRDASAAQVGYVPLDFRRARWAGPRSWKWRALPWLRRAQLPDLVDPGQPLGKISAAACAATGLPLGLPVIACAADKACEVLGVGADRTGVACLSLGSAATVSLSSRRFRGPARLLPPYPAACRGRWHIEAQVSEGFSRISWFRERCAAAQAALAATRGVPVETVLDELLARSPPGAHGLTAPPTSTPDKATQSESATPGSGLCAAPAFIGQTPQHTQADRYRALVEGIVFGLRAGLERIATRTGLAPGTLHGAGGGARSAIILQLASDIFGLPVARAQTAECSALGAAMNAAVGSGWYAHHGAAVAAMCHLRQVCKPDASSTPLYETVYRDRFLPLYAGGGGPEA